LSKRNKAFAAMQVLTLQEGKRPPQLPAWIETRKKYHEGGTFKTPPFAQSLRQAQILILEILNVFLWLKFSPSLIFNPAVSGKHFETASKQK